MITNSNVDIPNNNDFVKKFMKLPQEIKNRNKKGKLFPKNEEISG